MLFPVAGAALFEISDRMLAEADYVPGRQPVPPDFLNQDSSSLRESLVASAYINYWYWPTIGLVIGLVCLIAGMVVWLKRKDYRRNEEEYGGDSRKLDQS